MLLTKTAAEQIMKKEEEYIIMGRDIIHVHTKLVPSRFICVYNKNTHNTRNKKKSKTKMFQRRGGRTEYSSFE